MDSSGVAQKFRADFRFIADPRLDRFDGNVPR